MTFSQVNSCPVMLTLCCLPSTDKETLVTDAGKLTILDQLLGRLKTDGHRVLIYSQMTRMIDILEVRPPPFFPLLVFPFWLDLFLLEVVLFLSSPMLIIIIMTSYVPVSLKIKLSDVMDEGARKLRRIDTIKGIVFRCRLFRQHLHILIIFLTYCYLVTYYICV